MSLSLILDLLLVALLAATIGTAFVLYRRLGVVRGDHGRLDALAARFVEATARAEDGIGRLKLSTETLNARIAAAEAMAEDLRFLTEEANRAADRAEAGLRALRNEVARPGTAAFSPAAAAPRAAAPVHVPGPARAPEPSAVPRRQTEAERALIRALGLKEARSEPVR